jgi:Fe-S cluster biosynthesis and repair protein YggX
MRLPSGRAILNLISVETEEGLSRAQTMLANEDLKPGKSLERSIIDRNMTNLSS